jgi:hypothetical protein
MLASSSTLMAMRITVDGDADDEDDGEGAWSATLASLKVGTAPLPHAASGPALSKDHHGGSTGSVVELEDSDGAAHALAMGKRTSAQAASVHTDAMKGGGISESRNRTAAPQDPDSNEDEGATELRKPGADALASMDSTQDSDFVISLRGGGSGSSSMELSDPPITPQDKPPAGRAVALQKGVASAAGNARRWFGRLIGAVAHVAPRSPSESEDGEEGDSQQNGHGRRRRRRQRIWGARRSPASAEAPPPATAASSSGSKGGSSTAALPRTDGKTMLSSASVSLLVTPEEVEAARRHAATMVQAAFRGYQYRSAHGRAPGAPPPPNAGHAMRNRSARKRAAAPNAIFLPQCKVEPDVDLERDYDFGDTLGEGEFGCVFRCTAKRNVVLGNGAGGNSIPGRSNSKRRKGDVRRASSNSNVSLGSTCPGRRLRAGQAVAVKRVPKNRVRYSPERDMLASEIRLLSRITHDNIVTLLETRETTTCVCLVMELLGGGDLFSRIVDAGSFSETDARDVVRATARGLGHLHRLRVVHRDIKPENLLFPVSGTLSMVKICDFGLATELIGSSGLHDVCGSPTYTAPEVALRKRGG